MSKKKKKIYSKNQKNKNSRKFLICCMWHGKNKNTCWICHILRLTCKFLMCCMSHGKIKNTCWIWHILRITCSKWKRIQHYTVPGWSPTPVLSELKPRELQWSDENRCITVDMVESVSSKNLTNDYIWKCQTWCVLWYSYWCLGYNHKYIYIVTIGMTRRVH